jgi:hypothetical protein
MITLLTQIEATLNARPLCALSNDPVDFQALTPSHFLTLEPSTSLPDPNLKSVPQILDLGLNRTSYQLNHYVCTMYRLRPNMRKTILTKLNLQKHVKC